MGDLTGSKHIIGLSTFLGGKNFEAGLGTIGDICLYAIIDAEGLMEHTRPLNACDYTHPCTHARDSINSRWLPKEFRRWIIYPLHVTVFFIIIIIIIVIIVVIVVDF